MFRDQYETQVEAGLASLKSPKAITGKQKDNGQMTVSQDSKNKAAAFCAAFEAEINSRELSLA